METPVPYGCSPGNASPTLVGIRYVGDGLSSALFSFHYNGVPFHIVAANPEDHAGGETLVPPRYDFADSVEGRILQTIYALSQQFDEADADKARKRLEEQFADLAAMLYPVTHTLQVLTDFGQSELAFTCRIMDGYPVIPEPVSEHWLRAIGLDLTATNVPIVDASQVFLVCHLQGLAWKVTMAGEVMVCKTTNESMRGLDIAAELGTLLRIRSANARLSVPELKAIVVSRRGVVGILRFPNAGDLYHLLARIGLGDTLAERTISFRRMWALQIWDTKKALSKLGIWPWYDLRTDNIIINEDGDAVLLGLGGRNELPWVCHYPDGSVHGDAVKLLRIMSALKVERLSDAE
ncbi:uncharacterized protein B0T15DRAFT_566173 [Chaetomium strumarium]|uniref:Protein kinase domain-containing protein n=1 Tax=Chaetomium strumarium TaxID=1170767 RepID=A0AAJ0GUQ5_9PEZI|nr:hypothetical protein B0T15DRAFT_566173 [Chaetomium strumarium]